MTAAAGLLATELPLRRVVEQGLGLRWQVDADPYSLGLDALVGLALRDNPRRAQLVVSRVLGKHLPVPPAVALEAAGRLAGLVGNVADPVVLGYCETATGLGHAVAQALGSDGLNRLKAKFEQLATDLPKRSAAGERQVIGIGMAGPLYPDDYQQSRHARLVRSALTDIADALGDVDDFVDLYSDEERTNPAIAAAIAERMLSADRATEAMATLEKAADAFHKGGHWPEWQRVRIDALDALGRSGEAQDERWQVFERSLEADYLRAYIKRLPDFDDIEAEERALHFALKYPSFHQALAFLIDWPANDLAAAIILARCNELDGDRYWLLTPVAEVLEERQPLAATLLLRAMIDLSLDAAKYKRYGHAARHLQTCQHLAGRIDDFAGHVSHTDYVADLNQRHGTKSGFWKV